MPSETSLRLTGDWNPYLGIGLAVVLAALAWFLYRRESRSRPDALAWLLPTLRAAAVLLTVLILIGPVLHHAKSIQELGRLFVFVDSSQSMDLADEEMPLARKVAAMHQNGMVKDETLDKGKAALASVAKLEFKGADIARTPADAVALDDLRQAIEGYAESAGEAVDAYEAFLGLSGDTATGRGSLIAEIWTGDKARRLMDTPDRAALDDLPAPDRTKSAPLFEFPNTTEQGIFVRLRGYVHPPEDGKYRFWIAGDDECKLFFSENEDAKKARRIAQVGGWTEVRAWNTEGSQKSDLFDLKAGQRYYIEAALRGDGGDNHVAVAWQREGGEFQGPIPGEFLSPHENAARGAKGAAGGNLAGGGKSTAEEARADLADGARDLAKKIGGHEGGLTDPFKILDEFNTIADHAAGLKERVREDIASVAVEVGNAADEELKKKFAEFDAMTRWERTQRLLLGEGGALPKLAEGHDIELLALRGGDANSIWWQRRGGKKTSGDLPGEFGLPADGDGTDLAEAISRALDGQSEGAGVILISDGQHNTDSAPGDVAALLGRNRVPIFAIGTGTDKPTADVSVISVTAPGTVFSEDTVSGQLTINDEMKPGVAYRASIHYGDEMLWEKDFNTTNGSKRVFDYEFPIKKLVEAAEAARDPEKGALRNVPLAFSVKVEPKGGEEELAQIEHVTANNERPMFVQAVTQKRKVLILDGRPRWEMRYLNNQFDRDEQWEATALLDAIFDGKRGWPRGKEGALFPDSKELLFTYDLLVIGDLPGDLLTDEEQEWIKEFAERRGGGIVFVDGQRGHLRDLAKSGAPKAGDAESTPRGMAALFPVEWLPGATGPERGEESMPEKLTLTSDGLDLAALRFASNVQENIDTWEKLRPPHWVARSRPLPGTIVLGRAETKGGDSYPLFAWRRFGAGRVLYCGCDELWRWRYDVADRYHAKFWAQLANWIAEQPFSVAGRRVSIGSDKMVYRPGEAADLRVRLRDDSGKLVTSANLAATLYRDGKDVGEIELEADTNQGGVFRARTGELPPGKYEIAIKEDATFGGEAFPERAEFVVEPPFSAEMTRLSLNRELLENVARASGGQFFPEEEIGGIQNLLDSIDKTRVIESQTNLWSSYWWFGAIIACLTAEWILRKRAGYV